MMNKQVQAKHDYQPGTMSLLDDVNKAISDRGRQYKEKIKKKQRIEIPKNTILK